MPEKLPKTLSGLLRVAVEDVQKCESQPDKYQLDMAVWHIPRCNVCMVCMAGAVMAQRLGVKDNVTVTPSELGEAWEGLLSIDEMRVGEFWDAVGIMGIEDMTESQKEAVDACVEHLAPYEEDIDSYDDGTGPGHAPWHVYLECAEMLEKVGL